ncbi:MAG: ABC transporter permease [Bryobacterales bacterium]|nr:ABC transporter permease [Bryobacterales bacterium]
MKLLDLVWRSLSHYWRTNMAVIAGVAVAVAVLAGALLVGSSVRESLRDLVLGRLGKTDYAVAATNFFRVQLAADLAAQRSAGVDAYPLIALEGIVTHGSNRRVASKVAIYGVDEQFWKFHGVFLTGEAPSARTVRLSPALAEELAAGDGDSLVLRLDKPSEIPVESLHGRKEESIKAIRLSAGKVLSVGELGEFSLRPTQGRVRAVFVARERLQRELGQQGKANLLLLAGNVPLKNVDRALAQRATLDDLGIRIKILEQQGQLSLESGSMVLNAALLEAAEKAAASLGIASRPVLTYLVNSMKANGREVSYSLVTSVDLRAIDSTQGADDSRIILNQWTAQDLGAKLGDRIDIEYYVWLAEGRIAVERAQLTVSGIVPLAGAAADRDFAPEYPGITESATIHDWDPPFPMELSKIRPRDEDYWDKYRTTPKAYVSPAKGRQLWTSRYGSATSLRLIPPSGADLDALQKRFAEALRKNLTPAQMGMSVLAVRADGLDASQGSTDFGQYFLYFSFFLVISALLLVGLFFRLSVEQRYREAGLLRAVGYPVPVIGKLFQKEGFVLALGGSLLGVLAAGAYAGFILYGLRTWWSDAVSTPLLQLHWSNGAMVGGLLGGLATAAGVIYLTVRALHRPSPRALLQGSAAPDVTEAKTKRARLVSVIFALLGALQLAIGLSGTGDAAGSFFGAGGSLLIAAVALMRVWLVRGVASPTTVWRLGIRNASYRPGRSMLSIALIAFATFLIIALTAFRQEGASMDPAKRPGTGGFALVGGSALPVVHNPATAQGREELAFSDDSQALFRDAKVTALRLRPGDDSSCLNLYQPKNPRVLGVPAGVLARLPKGKVEPGEGVAAYVDANSLQYVLHKSVGDTIVLGEDSGKPVRLRIAGTLRDSIFQSEIVIAEEDFLKLFPEEQGFRMFLVDAPFGIQGKVTEVMEDRLKDYGLDLQPTVERLAAFHKVENAYLSTFQTLGGLGLLLGTVGLAAVLLRNVLERRKELALLRAVGYEPGQLATMVLAENTLLLACGLAAGTVCALLAIAPALLERGGKLPLGAMVLMLLAVFVTGMIASSVAVRAALGSPLLGSLRAE